MANVSNLSGSPSSRRTTLKLQEMTPSKIGQSSCRPEITKCSDTLINELMIGHQRDTPKLHCCFVLLKSQDLFNRLVDIYATQFKVYDRCFNHVIKFYDLPNGMNSKVKTAAVAYVSCWFWDLYVSIQQCVSKLPFTALNQHYKNRKSFCSDRYDPFLQHLNAVIRPTHTTKSLQDTLWIPVIREDINWKDNNPFKFDEWLMREDLVCGLLDVMDQNTNNWRTVPLSPPDTPGNPGWLLDWWQNQAYCWFPKEGHFTNEDLVAISALGIPLTPNLGPCDSGDWQMFPDNVMPANVVWSALLRVTPRNFYGSTEFRTYDTRTLSLPASVTVSTALPRPREGDRRCHTEVTQVPCEEALTDRIEFVQYRVTDWCYHAKVIFKLHEELQYQVLRAFLFLDSYF